MMSGDVANANPQPAPPCLAAIVTALLSVAGFSLGADAANNDSGGWQTSRPVFASPPSAPAKLAASPSIAAAKPAPLTLPEAVFIALRHNRAIRSEYLQRVSDKFALRVAESQFNNPVLNLNSMANFARQSGVRATTLNASPAVTWEIPTGAAFTFAWNNTQTNLKGAAPFAVSQPTLQVIQPLLQGAGVEVATAPLRIARITEEANQLNLRTTLINTITSVVTAYYQFVQARDQLRLAEDSLNRAKDLLKVNEALVDAGRLAKVELVQSNAAIAAQELSVVQARNAYDTTRLALLVLLALEPASQIVPAEDLSAIPVRIDAERALGVAFQNQPAYLTQLLQIKINDINLVVAKNARLWNLSVSGGVGQTAMDETVPLAVRHLPSTRPDYNVGLALTTQIGSLTPEQGEVNAKIVLEQSRLQLDQLRDQLKEQVADAVRTVDTQRQSVDIARRNRALSQQQLDIELVKLQAGRSSNFQVVSFQNDLLTAQSNELAAVVGYMTALVNLDQVMGTTLETWRISLND